MEKIKQVLILIFNWFIRRKAVYRIAGIGAFGYMLLELAAVTLPISANPDYEEIKLKYGELPKIIIGYLVDKFASGTNYWNLSIAIAIFALCVLIEYKILKPTKSVNATNIFSGWFQINNQTNNYDKE